MGTSYTYTAHHNKRNGNVRRKKKLWSNGDEILIPPQLCNPDFRFVKIRKGEKRPYEFDWTNSKNYAFNDSELLSHIAQGGNYGVVCGFGELKVLDADNKRLLEKVNDTLPKTFRVETGGGGTHDYYICPDIKKVVLEDSEHLGELQGPRTQVVGAGSIHPNGKRYKIINDIQIATVSEEDMREALKGLIKKDKIKEQKFENPVYNTISMNVTDVISGNFKRRGVEYQGDHPIHGSDTGMNFCLNPSKNVWHCFRCSPKDTKIPTFEGIKDIQHIKAGDFVFGKEYNKNKVINTFNFDKVEDIYSIKSYTPTIEFTQDHRIYVATIRYKGKHLRKADPTFSWKQVSDINERKDFLVVPKKHRTHLRSTHNNIELSKNLGKLLGWYIAEGHLASKQRANIQLTLSLDEEDVAKDLCKICEETFISRFNKPVKAKYYKYPNRGTITISIFSRQLYEIIEQYIGTGSKNKKIGKLINAPIDFLEAVVWNWIYGDGCYVKEKGTYYSRWSVSSISQQLVIEMQMILFKLGIPARYYKTKESNGYNDKHMLQWMEKPRHKSHFQDENNLYLPIHTSFSRKRIKVYAIKTEDKTYLQPFIVHNCDSGGSVFEWIAVKEGLIDCSDASPGCLGGALFKQVIELAKEKYGYIDPIQELIDKQKNNMSLSSDDYLALFHATRGKEARYLLSKDIVSKHYLVTHEESDTIYEFNGKYYTQRGNVVIKEAVEKNFKEEASMHTVNEVVGHCKRSTFIDESKFDTPNHWINCENGILDVENWEFAPHTPKFVSRNILPITYDPTKECPEIMQFLSEIVCESDIGIIQELAGYFLLKSYPIQKAFMFLGEGANGKSTLINLFQAFLGTENISNVSLQELSTNRFAPSHLVGKMANLYPDLPNQSLKYTGMFKVLTGGDSVVVEQKFKNGFSYVNHAKLVFSCNELPESEDESDAFFRRWIFVNFPNQFKGDNCDSKKIEKLITDDELSGFLNYAIAGLKRLIENGKFSSNVSTEEIREIYTRLASPIGAFVQDELEEDEDVLVSKEDMYEVYVEYCKITNLPVSNSVIFAKKINQYAPKIRSTRKRYLGDRIQMWLGYRLINKDLMNQTDNYEKDTTIKPAPKVTQM